MAVIWDVAQYSLVDTDQRFRGVYCLHHQGDLSEMVSTYESTRRHNPEEQHCQMHFFVLNILDVYKKSNKIRLKYTVDVM
jgi:hypothetical protein